MNQCKFCHKETKNKKFCSIKCLILQIAENRKKTRKKIKCYTCGKIMWEKPSIAKKKKYCSIKCYAKDKEQKTAKIGIKCETCNKFFAKKINSKKRFCSVKCIRFQKICKMCGDIFICNIYQNQKKFCSKKCLFDYKKKITKKFCLFCNKPLYKRKSYCNMECMALHYRQRLKGKKNPNFGLGEKIKQHWKDGKYNNVVTCKKHSYAKGGYYKGRWMRSSWEIKYAIFLDEHKIKYEYEKKIFKFADGTRYLPDFYIVDYNEWHEVKGWMDEKSIKKINLFRKEFFKEKLIIIDREVWKDDN